MSRLLQFIILILIMLKAKQIMLFVDEICALLEFYAAWNGSSLPTFRDR